MAAIIQYEMKYNSSIMGVIKQKIEIVRYCSNEQYQNNIWHIKHAIDKYIMKQIFCGKTQNNNLYKFIVYNPLTEGVEEWGDYYDVHYKLYTDRDKNCIRVRRKNKIICNI